MIKNIAKGLLIGISFLVPGVSGGTMMLILGVFEDALVTIDALTHGKLYNFKQLFFLGVGSVVSIVVFAPVISFLLATYRLYLIYFFAGVILAGLKELSEQTDLKKVKTVDIICGILGILFVFVLSSIKIDQSYIQQASTASFWILLLAGIPVSVALILPGISTSFLLLVFGIYEIVLNAIYSFNVSILLPLIIGIVVGTFMLTRFLNYCMKQYRRRTYIIIIGFVIASLVQILLETGLPQDVLSSVIVIVLFILGYYMMDILSKVSQNV